MVVSTFLLIFAVVYIHACCFYYFLIFLYKKYYINGYFSLFIAPLYKVIAENISEFCKENNNNPIFASTCCF